MIIEAADEAELFAFFTDTLGLPVAWPVAQWGRFREGGASVGDCNLGCNHVRDEASDPAPTLRRIALEPARPIEAVLDELEQGHRLLGEPIVSGHLDHLPDVAPYAPWQEGWTVALLETGLEPTPFVCAYDHDVRARVTDQEAELDAAGGGRLGVTGLRSVVISADDVEASSGEWASWLAPGTGPSLRVVAGDGPPALELGVRSTAAATAALDELGIGHDSADDGTVRLDPAGALGLDLRLTEARTR